VIRGMTMRGMETLTDWAATSMPRRVVGISSRATARRPRAITTVRMRTRGLRADYDTVFAVAGRSVTGGRL